MDNKNGDIATKLEEEYFKFVENIEKMCGIKNPFLQGMSQNEIAEITALVEKKSVKPYLMN